MSADDQIIVFNHGTGSKIKRREIALQAVSILHRSRPRARLVILENETPSRIPLFLNAADCLLVCSDTEGSPTIVKEAMACNLPIVAVDVGDIVERLAECTPSEIMPRDPDMLAEGLRRTLDLERRSNGRACIEASLDEHVIARQVLECYTVAIGDLSIETKSGKPLRIWLVTMGEPLPIGEGVRDRPHRVGSLAQLLSQKGHDVVWWTSTFDHSRKRHHFPEDAVFDAADHLTLRLLHGCGYENNLSFKRILDQRQVARKFSRLARSEIHKPDLILSSLPTIELSLAAVQYGRENDIPVVLDMRDMWPDIFTAAMPVFLRLLARIPLIPLFIEARLACAGATAITGITEEFVSWGLKRGGRSRTSLDRAFPMAYMSSPPVNEKILAAERYWDDMGVLKNDAPRTLCFIGALSRQFDIETVLSAAATCSLRNLPWRFVVCGVGDRLEAYKKKAAGLENVIFPGWIDRAQIHVLMQRSAAGLDPLPDRYDFLATINNKAIEYMSAGLPIISCPNRGVLADLLVNERCGLSYECGDADGLLNLLTNLTADKVREFSANSTKLFWDRFTTEKVYGAMAQYLEEVARSHPPRRHKYHRNYLVFRLDAPETFAEPLPQGFRFLLWRPSRTSLIPPTLGVASIAWWLFHFLRVMKNHDYAVLFVLHGDRPVHRSCILPAYFRCPFMGANDVQISSTWTDSKYLRKGLATAALKQVLWLMNKPGRRFWYITRENNPASISVCKKANFNLVAHAERIRFLGSRLLGEFRS